MCSIAPAAVLQLCVYHGPRFIFCDTSHRCTQECMNASLAFKRLGKAKWRAQGGQWHRPCPRSVAAVATAFDFVIMSLGRQYQTHPLTMRPRTGTLASDIRLTVGTFERAARADPQKIFLLTETSAQHFRSVGRTGAYEDRDFSNGTADAQGNRSEVDTCACEPARWTLGWRDDLLRAGVREVAKKGGATGRVRILPFYNLTQPRWDMHVAVATQQHASDGGSTRKQVCDCTHFCYDREFWSTSFFPSMERLIRLPVAALH